ncbi:MAG TPA: D-cysteine desulfhydrase family protein [Anaerolineaceae bacterium]|nr:D-cysteine desulfhydrase family protein [Anaerolineaceae bacterium]
MIPRLYFSNLPTPLEPLPRLTARLGGPRLFAKRDDLTGLALGGNKTRKLETLLAEAQANGAKTLITAGAVQSNHCRQTAAAAARFGFDCVLVLSGEVPARLSGNLLLDRVFGAEIVASTRNDRDTVLKGTFDAAWEDGRRPYLIPYGGSSPTGAAAYTLAFEEMLAQGESAGLRVDWIVFASSSGGTQAGLVVGARQAQEKGWNGKILGISVDESEGVLKDRVSRLADETADRLGFKAHFQSGDILVDASYVGEGYGVMGNLEREAIRLFAETEGLLLDPVYTGRAAGGMIDLIRKGFFPAGDTVLFWHTGGTPALFAEQYSQKLV